MNITIDDILSAAGFVRNVTYREMRFQRPPHETYVQYDNDWTARGADNRNFLEDHTYTVYVFSYDKPDWNAEKRLENVMNGFGIEFTKSGRDWFEDENLCQIVYEFEILNKITEEE